MSLLFEASAALFWISSLAYTVLIVLLMIGWLKGRTAPAQTSNSTSIAVIVPARNEEANVAKLLEALQRQSYKGRWELVIVNDASTDNTAGVVDDFLAKATQLNARQIQLEDDPTCAAPKKRALLAGIEATDGALIVTTDADCIPDPNWLSAIAATYEASNAKMICGPVAFHQDRTLFQRLQTLEFMSLIGSTAATINLGVPVMCNGANLAYEREAFNAVNGFSGDDSVASGDDVLLMLKLKKAFPGCIKFVQDGKALVYTLPQPNLKAFASQRKRWASKSKVYRDTGVIAVAATVLLINVSILIHLVGALFEPALFYAAAKQFILKSTLDFFFLLLVASFFSRKALLLLVLPEQLLYIVYVAFFGLTSWLGGYQWKGRTRK